MRRSRPKSRGARHPIPGRWRRTRPAARNRPPDASSRAAPWPRSFGGQPGDGAGDFAGVERPEIVGLLTHTDGVDRKAEFLGCGDQHASARGPVELVHDEASHARALAEHFDLRKAVLAGCRVQDQEDIVRGLGIESTEYAADLRQLLHQMRFVLEAAGGVDDEHVLAGRGCLADAVEHNPGSVAAFLARNQRRADAVTPDLQLLDRGRPEGVAGSEQDAVILLLQPMAELADGGGLARTVDADHQDVVW